MSSKETAINRLGEIGALGAFWGLGYTALREVRGDETTRVFAVNAHGEVVVVAENGKVIETQEGRILDVVDNTLVLQGDDFRSLEVVEFGDMERGSEVHEVELGELLVSDLMSGEYFVAAVVKDHYLGELDITGFFGEVESRHLENVGMVQSNSMRIHRTGVAFWHVWRDQEETRDVSALRYSGDWGDREIEVNKAHALSFSDDGRLMTFRGSFEAGVGQQLYLLDLETGSRVELMSDSDEYWVGDAFIMDEEHVLISYTPAGRIGTYFQLVDLQGEPVAEEIYLDGAVSFPQMSDGVMSGVKFTGRLNDSSVVYLEMVDGEVVMGEVEVEGHESLSTNGSFPIEYESEPGWITPEIFGLIFVVSVLARARNFVIGKAVRKT